MYNVDIGNIELYFSLGYGDDGYYKGEIGARRIKEANFPPEIKETIRLFIEKAALEYYAAKGEEWAITRLQQRMTQNQS